MITDSERDLLLAVIDVADPASDCAIGNNEIAEARAIVERVTVTAPIQMQLWCPLCHTRHVDEGKFATKPHTKHACQNPTCGLVWQPALVATVGVYDLPGYLNAKIFPRAGRACGNCGAAVGIACASWCPPA